MYRDNKVVLKILVILFSNWAILWSDFINCFVKNVKKWTLANVAV